MGLGLTVSRVVMHWDFHRNPTEAAEAVWVSSGRFLAANGAVMRTAPLAVPALHDAAATAELAAAFARVTHADPRAVASSVCITAMLREIIVRGITVPTELLVPPAPTASEDLDAEAVPDDAETSTCKRIRREDSSDGIDSDASGPVDFETLVDMCLSTAKPYSLQVGYSSSRCKLPSLGATEGPGKAATEGPGKAGLHVDEKGSSSEGLQKADKEGRSDATNAAPSSFPSASSQGRRRPGCYDP